MPSFEDLIDDVSSLSIEEMEEMRRILNKILIDKKREHFLEVYEQALKDNKANKLFTSNNFDEITKWLNSSDNA